MINPSDITRYDEDQTVFKVPFDDATVAWIMEIADLAHIPPAQLIASIVRDVARDDQNAHLTEQLDRSPLPEDRLN